MCILSETAENSVLSWFGFLNSVREDSGIRRDDMTAYIESKNIQMRLLFSGNIIKQPCCDMLRRVTATAWPEICW